MNKPTADAAPAPETIPAPPPDLIELLARSGSGLTAEELRAASGLGNAALQAALDALEAQGRIAVGVRTGMLCYHLV